ncbi:hypothetical protein Lfu02_47620 [Longispora fulva]|uniref:Uncharacterized protein n=1 Tax=Longispora fulva TaxID=619741 RepID=A0A8J7KXP3_9ACTN|nr:hypothetical protein [Longispora fulva]MBG6138137.1 hypothetical protein [Longispora fulva]GIG60390.1 hypothetical protein Lfu02_47620 [Longispora fulva]
MKGAGLVSPAVTGGVGATPRWSVRLRWALAGIAGSWLLALAAHLVGLDWLLPLVLLAGTTLVVRSSRFVADRVVVAGSLLFGATCAAGLLISVWPWHMHPVPVAGTALSAVVVLAAVRGVPLSLTPRFRLVDVTIPICAMLAAGVAWYPMRVGRFTARFAEAASGGDMAAHFMIFDGIRGAGGYTFLQQDAASASVPPSFLNYPQGGHFVAALLDAFVRPGARPDGLTSLNDFLWINLGSLVLLCAVLAWAVNRVAGPGFRLMLALPTTLLAASLVCLGDLQTVVRCGFWAELVCLSLLVVLCAVLIRPLRSTGEQIAVVSALFVAIAYTYYFVLPVAAVAVLAFLFRYRGRVRRRWVLTGVAVVLTAGLSAVPVVVNVLAVQRDLGTGTALTALGAIDPMNGTLMLALAGLVVAGLFGARGRLGPAGELLLAVLVASAGYAGAIAVFQYRTAGYVSYYYEKALHVVAIVLVIGLGLALRRLLPNLVTPGGVRGVRAILVCLALTATSMQVFNPMHSPLPTAYDRGSNLGRLRLKGKLAQKHAGAMIETVLRVPDPDRRTTIVLPTFGDEVFVSVWIAVIERDYPGLAEWRDWASIGRRRTPDELVAFLRAHPGRYQVVTTDAAQRAAILKAGDTLDVEVVAFDPNPKYVSSW